MRPLWLIGIKDCLDVSATDYNDDRLSSPCQIDLEMWRLVRTCLKGEPVVILAWQDQGSLKYSAGAMVGASTTRASFLAWFHRRREFERLGIELRT